MIHHFPPHLSPLLLPCSYYQKVPEELPEPEKHQVYGLATPEDFTMPPHHQLWTEETYAAFQATADASEKYDTKVRQPHQWRAVYQVSPHVLPVCVYI